jgi:hypothetical protein
LSIRAVVPIHRADAGREDKQLGRTVKTNQERAEERRQAKLELLREQVDNGSLVIRQMTAEERLLYPPRAPRRKRYY